MGAQVIGSELAKLLIDVWLRSEFAEGPLTPKVAKIKPIDERFRRRE